MATKRNDLLAEIDRLEHEWDKLDGSGQDDRQRKVAQELAELREQLKKLPPDGNESP